MAKRLVKKKHSIPEYSIDLYVKIFSNAVMVSRAEILLSWLALPVYVWQGLAVRRSSIRMAPPVRPANVEIEGEGDELRILVVGDSSAAGVGVSDFNHSVAGRLPHLLAKKTKRPVSARTSGNNSATAGQILNHVVPNLEFTRLDYIVINIGTNDAKNFHSGKRFCKEFGGLLYALQAKFPGAQIIWSGLIDISNIPLLPSPLNKILGIRSRVIRKNGKILCYERGALAPETNWRPVRENFAEDGFHASSQGYEEWADA